MQCVYILTNEHVPNLVKFGFSTRDPHDRAAELSTPTGVPGQWIVHHYWRVADGYATEQSIFHKFRELRLDRQEFLRFTAHEAVQAISQELQRLGSNPIEQARKRDERKVQTRLERAAQKLVEDERLVVIQQRLDARKAFILEQIKDQQSTINKRPSRLGFILFIILFIIVTLAIIAAIFNANIGHGIFMAIIVTAVIIFFGSMIFVVPLIVLVSALSRLTENVALFFYPKTRAELNAIETKVLTSHGFKYLYELDDPRTLP